MGWMDRGREGGRREGGRREGGREGGSDRGEGIKWKGKKEYVDRLRKCGGAVGWQC